MINKTPFFSVGVPTFNRGDLLRSALTQLLQQSHPDFELIVSDNASTDHTTSVVQSFKDPRIKYVRHPLNIGALNNFLSLADLAVGRYFILHQDDDFLHRDFLRRCFDAVQDRPDIVLYATSWWRGNSVSGFKSKLLPDFRSATFEHVLQDQPLILEGRDVAVSLLHSFHFSHPTVALDLATLRKVGGYFAEADTVNDVITEARVLSEGKLAYDPRPGGIFTDHASNCSRTMKKDFKVLVYRNMYRQLLEDFDARAIPWSEILVRNLKTYSDKDMLALFAQWARYHAPKRLQDVAWSALSSRKEFSFPGIAPKLLRKVGIRNLCRFLMRR